MPQPEPKEDLYNVLLSVGILTGFVFIVSMSVYLIRESFATSCSCRQSIPLVIAVLTSLGVFVGLLTYYLLSKSFFRQKQMMAGSIEKTLDFLEPDEKRIVSALISQNGSSMQNSLKSACGMDPVRLHRRLAALRSKGIVKMSKSGMTNMVELEESYKRIFIN